MTDLAQLAQLLMDEGYLRYQRSPKPVHDIYGREHWGYYPRCRIGKYDKEDIEYFAELLSTEPRLYRKTWRIELAGAKLLRILSQIKPYMRGEKLPQVETMLEHGKFYIPKEKVKQSPTGLSLVKPEKLKEYLKMKEEIIPHVRGLKRPTREEIETMKKLKEQGLNLTEIAQILGYSHPTVSKYLKI